MSCESPEAILKRHSKSFALAGLLLPSETRRDAAVLYAWCRRADDAIDLGPDSERSERLRTLRAELADVYTGKAQSDTLLADFQDLVRRRSIPLAHPSALLDGLEMDLGRVRFATLSELLLYAHRVAGVVGLMMCHVLGVLDAGAQRRAAHLGIAMQLTNICRDVDEDRLRDRVYLPADVVASCRSSVSGTVKRLLVLADDYYRSGERGIRVLPARAAFAIRTARLVYAAIGNELARRGYDPFAGRARVAGWKKGLLILRALAEESVSRVKNWLSPARPRGPSHDALAL